MARHRLTRRSESGWDMSRREAFTLIEVMIAVMIISVVITALLQLQSNNTKSFMHLQKMQQNLQYLSLLQGGKYGYENDTLTLDRMVERFDLDDDLRRKLKNIHAEIIYQKLDTIDMKEFSDFSEENSTQEAKQSPLVLEVGRTILQLPGGSASIMRVRVP